MIMMKRYKDKKPIGHGMFSDVYSAVDEVTGKTVALKITEPMDERPPHNSRFELQLLQKFTLNNEIGVIHLIESFEILDELVMVLPFYQYTLRDVLLRYSKRSISYTTQETIRINKMPSDRVKNIFQNVMNLLSNVHSHGIIHRDIKPENILFTDIDSEPVLADFGISWQSPNNNGKEPVNNKICDVSTGIYKAPELIFGYTSYSMAIDIWAMGVVLTEMYSTNCEPILDESGNHSDIALLSSVLSIFGTQGLQDWHEVKDVESFKNMQFINKQRQPTKVILPRCDDVLMQEIFNEMMQYESSRRITAAQIVKLLQ